MLKLMSCLLGCSGVVGGAAVWKTAQQAGSHQRVQGLLCGQAVWWPHVEPAVVPGESSGSSNHLTLKYLIVSTNILIINDLDFRHSVCFPWRASKLYELRSLSLSVENISEVCLSVCMDLHVCFCRFQGCKKSKQNRTRPKQSMLSSSCIQRAIWQIGYTVPCGVERVGEATA